MDVVKDGSGVSALPLLAGRHPRVADMTSPPVRSFLMRHDLQQDRLALVCERVGGRHCLVWLSHHLAVQLVSALVNTIWQSAGGAQPGRESEMSMGHAQLLLASAANDNGLLIEEPGHVSEQYVVTDLDMATPGAFLSTTFRCGEATVSLQLNKLLLARWLRVIHAHFCLAQWHYPDWPDWLLVVSSRSFFRPDIVFYCDWQSKERNTASGEAGI